MWFYVAKSGFMWIKVVLCSSKYVHVHVHVYLHRPNAFGFWQPHCTCVTKHSNTFQTFLNWLKNSKRVWHEPKTAHFAFASLRKF